MTTTADPFHGDGEVRALGRALDWSATSLGPVDDWPGPLRDIVRASLESPFPISLWCGPDLVLVYNDAYRRLLGAKHPAALGRPGPDVWAEIWDGIAPFFERIRAGGPPAYQEDAPFYVRRDETEEVDGREPNAWFTFSVSPVRDQRGEIVAFLNIVSESTRRVLVERSREAVRAEAERAEARLRDVFAQAPAFMAVLRGENHVFEYVNEAYYQLVGHRELIGRAAWDALPDLRGQGFEELLDSVLATGQPYVGREVSVMITRVPGGEPEERFIDLVYYPITEADGARTGVVAHGSDVTDHVLDRRSAQRARAEAEHANRAKSQFLATMSHEIRTPINAVMGYADLLDAGVAGPLTDRQRGYVEGIRSSSQHLHGLVSDVLDLAKIEAGEMKVSVEDMPIRPVITWALQIIEPQAERKNLTVRLVWESDRGVRVLGDSDRLRQVLLNLLANSLKFTEENGTITVRCVEREAADAAALPEVGPWVVVEVEDTGRGIPATELDRVFEPFVQAEAGHTRRAAGTGLGLTISRRLARLMGGDLTAESEEGVGSTFSLWLPVATQDRLPLSVQAEEAARPWPPEPHELPGLAAAGETLLAAVARVELEWVDRLRADARIRPTEGLSRARLSDHTAPLVSAIAHTLIALEEAGAEPPVLDDADTIQATIARRHGHQRRRLGWGKAEVEREYGLLLEVVEATLRRETPKRTAANLATALAISRRLVARASAASLAAYD